MHCCDCYHCYDCVHCRVVGTAARWRFLTSCPVLFVPPHFCFFFYPSADSRTMWALRPVATGLAYIIIPILNMEDFIISRDITIRTVPETVNTAGSNFCRFHWTLSLCPSTLKLHPTPLCCFTGSRVFIKRINPNSTTRICCGFVVKQAVQQIHNKSKAYNKLYNKSTTSLHVEMLWICCGFVVDF